MAAFDIVFAAPPDEELASIRVFDRRRIIEEIEKQLTREPDKATKRKKLLSEVAKAAFEFSPPLWELRIGDYRVFYDLDVAAHPVTVRAVRSKPAEKTTEDVVNETDQS